MAQRVRLALLIGTVLSVIFLIFGLLMLGAAYYQNHPVVFLALFFSSCLVILFSLVALVGIFFRFRRPAEGDPACPGD